MQSFYVVKSIAENRHPATTAKKTCSSLMLRYVTLIIDIIVTKIHITKPIIVISANTQRRQAWARGLRSPKMSLTVTPHREPCWSKIRRRIVWNFQILVVSAVKICKQCLQIASAFSPYRGFDHPGPHWGTSIAQPTNEKFLALSLNGTRRNFTQTITSTSYTHEKVYKPIIRTIVILTSLTLLSTFHIKWLTNK